MVQSTDSIVEMKKCAISGQEFSITQWDLDFYDKISPMFAGQKFQIPTPTLCPEERQRRRLSFRNERSLYRRTCDASGKQIISIYSPDKPYKVYDQKIRRSDSWDSMDYGVDFDFSKTFTENFRELMLKVPRISLTNTNSENCEYCNPWFNNKNCYLIYSITNSEDSMYWRRIDYCKKCFDNLSLKHSEVCYYCISCLNCFSCFWCNNLKDCSYCINCYDLTGVQYHINNKKYTKEQYEEYIRQNGIKIDLKYLSNHNNELDNFNNNNCLWKYIINSKDCISCYDVTESENLKYCEFAKPWSKNSIDSSLILASEFIKEGMSSFNQYKCIGSVSCRWSNNTYYSDACYDSQNLFWCISLRNKSYCIFNKQYTKEEYDNLVARIITHMQETGERWEFFHPSLSPFGYNETIAQEYYPLQKRTEWTEKSETLISANSEVSASSVDFWIFWYNRSTYESPKPVSDKVIQGQDLPDSIDEVQDDILHYAIACEVTGKLFRIQPQELAFYRKHHIPLPRKHPDQRHIERLVLRK